MQCVLYLPHSLGGYCVNENVRAVKNLHESTETQHGNRKRLLNFSFVERIYLKSFVKGQPCYHFPGCQK